MIIYYNSNQCRGFIVEGNIAIEFTSYGSEDIKSAATLALAKHSENHDGYNLFGFYYDQDHPDKPAIPPAPERNPKPQEPSDTDTQGDPT